MNIEELELSLRSEFEGQMKSVVARLRQDVIDFQKTFEAEFEKQREQLHRSIDELANTFPESLPLENAFKSTITEHLRLARDEGAQIAATAFGEAEKLRSDNSPVTGGDSDKIRDAVNAICSKRTQAAILTALVDHASHFAPRGAFFILKNDNFVGWKAFGIDSAEAAVRDVHFPANCSSTLSDAVSSLSTTRSEYGIFVDDHNFLDPLGLSHPAEMYAIPLSARGRGVAVLYVDNASDEGSPNLEALETLVRVAGLTVELLAAQSAKPSNEHAEQVETRTEAEQSPEPAHSAVAEAVAEEVSAGETVEGNTPAAEQENEIRREEGQTSEESAEEVSHGAFESDVAQPYEFESTSSNEVESEIESSTASYEFESNSSYEFEASSAYEAVEVSEPADELSHEAPVEEVSSTDTMAFEPVEEATSFEFSSNDTYDASASHVQVETAIPHVEFAAEEVSVVPNVNGYTHVQEPEASPLQPEPVVETATVEVPKPKLRDRNVDLPIEVSEGERKLHNDARRFARLLVSEIKLYNEQKVAEGREKYDLYDRLREAIDRSREMYEKRVQPAVASKYDYFHYELVNGLAETDPKKLGGNYPGATV